MTGAIDIEAVRKLAEEAKARAEAATPGEWQVATGDEAPGTAYRVIGLLSSEIAFICSTYGVQPVDLTDATFIAAARADVPALADLVLALLDEREADMMAKTQIQLDAEYILDGFGGRWPVDCPACGAPMQVIRPGDARCSAECYIKSEEV